MIRIQREDFAVDEIIRELKGRGGQGAVVSFVGVVRAEEGLEALELETYEDMALEKLGALEKSALSKFGVEDVVIVHRRGTLKPGENILLVAVSSAHRKEAFAACEWLIDELKRVTPIWKKDVPMGKDRAADGASRRRREAEGPRLEARARRKGS